MSMHAGGQTLMGNFRFLAILLVIIFYCYVSCWCVLEANKRSSSSSSSCKTVNMFEGSKTFGNELNEYMFT